MTIAQFFAAITPRGARAALLPVMLAALAACSDDGRFPAQFDTATYSVEVGAINGTPLGEPAALSTIDRRAVRLDATYNFDVAFDIDDAGRPVVIPQGLVGTPAGAARPVGLQRLGTSFEDATMAPRATSGWLYDSTLTVVPGEIVGVQSRPSICDFDFDPYVYSKLRVDSVRPSIRRLYVTALTNPNCGYRSLVPGRPSN